MEKLAVYFTSKQEYESAKYFFESDQSAFAPYKSNDEFRVFYFEDDFADALENYLGAELNEAGYEHFYFDAV